MKTQASELTADNKQSKDQDLHRELSSAVRAALLYGAHHTPEISHSQEKQTNLEDK